MCRHFCVTFVDFMLIGKKLLDYANLSSPNKYEKNEKKTLKYFQHILKRLKR